MTPPYRTFFEALTHWHHEDFGPVFADLLERAQMIGRKQGEYVFALGQADKELARDYDDAALEGWTRFIASDPVLQLVRLAYLDRYCEVFGTTWNAGPM